MIKRLNINNMKKVFVYLVCALMLCSCGNGKKKAEEARKQAYYESLAKEIRLKELEFKRVRDSLDEYAWGDAKFGITMKDALKTEAFKGFKKDGSSSLIKTNGDNHLFSTIKVYFYKDKLYNVKIIADDNIREDEYDNKVPELIIKFKQLISEKYGDPDISHSIPTPYVIKKGYYNYIHIWTNFDNNKEIDVFVGRDSYGSYNRWSVGCEIVSKKDLDLIEQERNAKEQANKKKQEQKERESSLF